MEKVSIIVPIYNVEKYLHKCLDSLVNQTLKDIEIILVNDASPDHSDEIMRTYERMDNRIKCFYLEVNISQGGARNLGIRKASGKYITFVDSDDYIDETMMEKLYLKAEETGSDLVFCNFQKVGEDGKLLKRGFLYPPEFAGDLCKALRGGMINKPAYTWGKLYKRELIIDNKIYFPEKVKHEDSYFMPLISLYVQRTAMVGEALYYYLQRSDSVMNTTSQNFTNDQIVVANRFLDEVKKRGLYDEYIDEIDYYMIKRSYVNTMKKCMRLKDYTATKATRKLWKKKYRHDRSNKHYLNIVGEDRLLISMILIHPRLGIYWYKKGKSVMRVLAKSIKSSIYYSKYYSSHRNDINQLFSLLGKYQSKLVIVGAELKRKAFLPIGRKSYKKDDIFVHENIEYEEDPSWLDSVDAIVVVNPSFYLRIYEYVRQYRPTLMLINLDDYLEGYINLDYYSAILSEQYGPKMN